MRAGGILWKVGIKAGDRGMAGGTQRRREPPHRWYNLKNKISNKILDYNKVIK